ncbi:PhaM family polyhydroxyalkanoate granule multifunctional regulatory protein [Noviherbaspirillum sp.]|uniref:PhaM family polyhydroxyalkanoate granule multifunctional regulatory protein n=1 Tax=Noviherbaspirillum sp. TaxID=1926288 RepID=UPI002FE42359
MPKSDMPNIPGMGAMTDSLDFVKNLWGSMGIPGMNMPGANVSSMNIPGMSMPGMVMPTLSVEEIRKKISDLKAVESWLELNMNMLRGTIQALEVQAATIATLQSMGDALSASMQGAQNGQANGKHKTPDADASAPGAKPAQKASSAPQPTGKDQADAASLTAPLVNAAAWWNMLQDQFKQAVNNAATAADKPAVKNNGSANGKAAEAPKARPEEEAPPAAKTRRKPAK